MMFEYAASSSRASALQPYLTRFGTMLFETASFLYSLFDDDKKSINLLKIWRGFDHPFDKKLKEVAARLEPFKEELRLVRNRVGFHGSLTRGHESAGLGIFGDKSPRAREFSKIIRDTQNLALKMIKWYIEGMNEAEHPREIWREFEVELKG